MDSNIQNLEEYFEEDEIKILKYNLYSLDWWIWQYILEFFEDNLSSIKEYISNLTILNLLAILKQTFFGFLMYLTFLRQKEAELNKDLKINSLIKIYLNDILILPNKDDIFELFKNFVKESQEKFEEFLDYFIKLDDNKLIFNYRYCRLRNN